MRKTGLFSMLVGLFVSAFAARADEVEDLIPPGLSPQQQQNIRAFLGASSQSDRPIRVDARVLGVQGGNGEIQRIQALSVASPAAAKQYLVQIIPHRPVPGQEQINRADVYYFRPSPEKGKAGTSVRQTVDLGTGEPVGAPEYLLNYPLGLSGEELSEALALAKKSKKVDKFYAQHGTKEVQWDYMTPFILAAKGRQAPGDRVAFLRFFAGGSELRVTVNLTRERVYQN